MVVIKAECGPARLTNTGRPTEQHPQAGDGLAGAKPMFPLLLCTDNGLAMSGCPLCLSLGWLFPLVSGWGWL